MPFEFLFEKYKFELKNGSSMIARFAEYEDEEDIIRIFNESYGQLHPDSYWSLFGFFKYAYRFLGFVDNEVAGIVQFERIPIKNKNNEIEYHGHVGYVLVRPKFQRIGVGTSLTKLAIMILRKFGVKVAWAVTEYDNIGSIKMLKAAGFKQVPEEFIERKYGKEAKDKLLKRFVFIRETDIIFMNTIGD